MDHTHLTDRPLAHHPGLRALELRLHAKWHLRLIARATADKIARELAASPRLSAA